MDEISRVSETRKRETEGAITDIPPQERRNSSQCHHAPALECKKAPMTAFTLLDLPKEIRLIVYEYLPEYRILSNLLLPCGIHYYNIQDKICDMSILRTCRTIYEEARPTIMKEMQFKPWEPRYHLSTSRSQGSTWLFLATRCLPHTRLGMPRSCCMNPALDKLETRIRNRKPDQAVRAAFQLDYDPRLGEVGYQADDDLACALGKLKWMDEEPGMVVNIWHEEKWVPVRDFLQQIDSEFLNSIMWFYRMFFQPSV